jgi:hypothetical protein
MHSSTAARTASSEPRRGHAKLRRCGAKSEMTGSAQERVQIGEIATAHC